ncbi:MAG TPA: DUF3999 family protein [Bryobacteraceae bacterium]|jgi:hypothetical protein
MKPALSGQPSGAWISITEVRQAPRWRCPRFLGKLSFLFAAAFLARGDFNLQDWQTRIPITVEQPGAAVAVAAGTAVYKASQAELKDVRIVRAGVEIPYRLQVLTARQEQIELQPAVLNKAAVPNEGVEAVLDLNGHPSHNRLRIATALRNFKETVRIETSDDGRTWAMARNDGLIFDISRVDRQVAELSVDYPVSTRRYVRVTIPGWHNPAYLASAWLTYFAETGAVRDSVASLSPAVTEDAKAQATLLTGDIGFGGLAYDRVELAVAGDASAFSRRVEVATSGDGKAWSYAGEGAISRTAGQERLSVDFPEQWKRYLRVTVFHGDSAPLKIARIRLSDFRRLIAFSAKAAGEYWLYAGNPKARQPSYDVSGLPANTANPADASLGGAEANPQYRAPERPWTDRNPYILNFVLIAAVAVMGYVTILLLRRVRTG